jgi:single-strand DNA-binding protein
MSNNINVTVLSGRVCADAELKYTNNGTAVCNFSLAVNKYRSTQEGQGKEEVSFFNCEMFGKSAESFNQRLLKGIPVIINGELKQDRWNDNEGKTQSRVHIIVNRIELVYTGQQNTTQGNQQANGQPAQGVNPYMYSTPPSQGGQRQQYGSQNLPQQSYQAPQGYQQPPQGYQQARSYQAPPATQGQFNGLGTPSGVRPQDGQPYMAGPESFKDDDIPF